MVIEVKRAISESLKQEYEKELTQETEKKAEFGIEDEAVITPQLVALELYTVYRRCMQEIPVTAKDKETGKQVPTGVYQFDARSALKALQLLGDAVGLFKDKSASDTENRSYEDFLKSGGFEYEF